ncbi:hypothetical protein ACFLYR_09435, partial [Chloroflexota bacterium]
MDWKNFRTYDWVNDNGYQNLGEWVEAAYQGAVENLLSVIIRRHREWIVPMYMFEISKWRLVFVVTAPNSVRNP